MSPVSNCALTTTADVPWDVLGSEGEPALTIASYTGLRQGYMVWGVILFDSRIHLVFVSGTVTEQFYDSTALWHSITGYVAVSFRHPGLTFQHDNASSHMARVGMNYLHACPILPWLAWLLGLSLIEHIWDVMWKRLQPTRNIDNLVRQFETIWQEILQDIMFPGRRWTNTLFTFSHLQGPNSLINHSSIRILFWLFFNAWC